MLHICGSRQQSDSLCGHFPSVKVLQDEGVVDSRAQAMKLQRSLDMQAVILKIGPSKMQPGKIGSHIQHQISVEIKIIHMLC